MNPDPTPVEELVAALTAPSYQQDSRWHDPKGTYATKPRALLDEAAQALLSLQKGRRDSDAFPGTSSLTSGAPSGSHSPPTPEGGAAEPGAGAAFDAEDFAGVLFECWRVIEARGLRPWRHQEGRREQWRTVALTAARYLLGDHRPAGQWRPIETGPRDGTFIDLWVSGGDIDQSGPMVRRVLGCWGREAAFFGGQEGWKIGAGVIADPYVATHWMPLPEPPTGETAALGGGIDTGLVCTTCRWRAGHAPDCPRIAEPWPTLAETSDTRTAAEGAPPPDVSDTGPGRDQT